MIRRTHLALFVLFMWAGILACGGSPPPADDADDDPTCAGIAPSNACMNPDNFEFCRALEEQCPGEVEVMESCPLQFSCPNTESQNTP